MELHGYQDPIRCRAFAITLKGPALAWFNRLPSSAISSFTKLSIAFVSHFIKARTYRKSSYHLLTIKQSSQESLRSYVQRFNAESLKVDILYEKFAITAFIARLGVQSKDLMFSISKNPEASMAEVLAKIEKYINGEEALLSKQRSSSTQKEKSRGDKKRERSPKTQAHRDRSPRRNRENRERSPKRRGNIRDRLGPPQPELQQQYSPRQYTPLTTSGSQVLREVQHEKFLRWPSQIKSDPVKRDNTKYCEFHRDHRHRTDDCIQLRKEIEYLIRHGHLRCYVASEGQEQVQPPPPRQPTPAQHQPPLGEIHVISGGFAGGGESSSARKAHLGNIRLGETLEVQTVSKIPRLDTTITFSDFDMEGCQHPYDNPLVIKAIVANKKIQRVLVDNGSSTDIIFASVSTKWALAGRS